MLITNRIQRDPCQPLVDLFQDRTLPQYRHQGYSRNDPRVQAADGSRIRWKPGGALFLAENKVSAGGEGDVHGRPGDGTREILFLVVQQFSFGLHRPVTERVRVGASRRIAVGSALQSRVFVGKGQCEGADAHLFASGPGGSLEGGHGVILFSAVIFVSGVVLGTRGEAEGSHQE